MDLVVLNHLSLDGVMQGPGDPDEDRRGGFAHGGWAAAGADQVMGEWIGPVGDGGDGAMLLGRRSYESMLGAWNERGGPFKDAQNSASKYVASRSPDTPLAWPNSTLLTGDVPSAVAALKDEGDGRLLVMGSGELVRTLVDHDLVDELRLAIHPLLLGGGVRLFPDTGLAHRLELVECQTSTTGVLLVTYHRAEGRASPAEPSRRAEGDGPDL
jgi:dihydrofolate reductase